MLIAGRIFRAKADVDAPAYLFSLFDQYIKLHCV